MALTKVTQHSLGNSAVTTAKLGTAPFGFANSSANVVYMAANGNVGIGNSAPGHLISVNGSAFIKDGVGGVPIFYARQTTGQNLINDTNTKIQYNTVVYDTNSFFTGGSTSRFQPTIAGYYLLNANYRSGTGGNASCAMSFYVSGTAYISSHHNQQGINDHGSQISAIVYLNGSQYVEVWVNQNSGGTVVTSNADNLGNANTLTWWQGMLIRAA